MTTIKVYGLSCESRELAEQMQQYTQRKCQNTAPIGWRMKDLTSQQARAQALREGWKRVKHQGRYGVAAYDICRTCYPVLDDALKLAQKQAAVERHAQEVQS